MYAVVRSGSKQYRVVKDDILTVEKLDAQEGQSVIWEDVLLIGRPGQPPRIGMPLVKGACVRVEVLRQHRGPKVLSFKKRPRNMYRRLKGHRQFLTLVKVLSVEEKAKPAAQEPAAEVAALS